MLHNNFYICLSRYGLKNWLLCDSVTSYAWQIQPYLGKTGNKPERAQGQRVVLDLVEKLPAGHCVTCDNFFTSLELGEALVQRGITLLGTIRKNKPELPPALKQLSRQKIHSSIFGFTKSATAVSYVAPWIIQLPLQVQPLAQNGLL